MIIRRSCSHSLPKSTFLLPSTTTRNQRRTLHSRLTIPPVPPPTPFVPDHNTFLTLIGRGLSQHASKIPSWDALFTLTSPQLRELGVEPPRARRYLLRWLEKFRRGEYGVAGDVKNVIDGRAEVRVVEVPSDKVVTGAESPSHASAILSADTKKVIVNLPDGARVEEMDPKALTPVQGLKIKGAHTIVGPKVLPVKGSLGGVARIEVKEGLWEVRRGHKVDGGERRRAEVRSKRRAEERKNAR